MYRDTDVESVSFFKSDFISIANLLNINNSVDVILLVMVYND